MYTISNLNLMKEVEMILKLQKTADIKYDGMELRYKKESEGIKTILMGIDNWGKYLEIEEGNHYHRTIITLVIPEGIDIIGPLFCKDGFHVDLCGRFVDRVKLPKSCIEIYDSAFYGCYNLEDIEWGSVTKVGYRALLHTLIIQKDIPLNISTDSQVCSNDDFARRQGRTGYLEYFIYGEWREQSIEGLKDVMNERRKEKFLRINRIGY